MNLAPISNAGSLAFVERLSTFLYCLTSDTASNDVPETAVLAAGALQALLSPKREILAHSLFEEGSDRLTAFADRLNQGLPADMAVAQKYVYEKNFRPSVGLSEEYQSSQYFRLLAAQMIDGLRHCSPDGWAPVVDDLPFKDQMHLANALEMFGDAKIGGQVRERCQRRAAELFWSCLLSG